METEIQLEDLLPIYPPVNAPHFQTLISAKEEFRELATSLTEPRPGQRGQFFKHQILFERFMEQYDDCFLMHKTGTGKTCSVVAMMEYAKRLRAEGGHIKRAIIVVRGSTLRAEFKHQLVCRCTPKGVYDTPTVDSASSISTQKTAITNEVKKWYKITTYHSLAKTIATKYPNPSDDARLAEDYADTIFFIDEVQNMRVDPIEVTSEEKRIKRAQKKAAKRIGNPRKTNKPRAVTLDKPEIYRQIKRLFLVAKRCKRIIATATPMLNNRKELGPLMNLILPAHMQIPDNFNYNTATLEQMEPYFRGRISYIREMETGAYKVYKGEPTNAIYDNGKGETYVSQLVLKYSYMSPFQSEVYMRAKTTSNKSNYFFDERQASNFVFPNGTWGNEGFNKYVEQRSKDFFVATPELLANISDINRLRVLSCKYADIIEGAMNNEGNVFIFDEYVTGSGNIVLGLCLEALGFEKFNESSSIFMNTQIGRVRPYCSGDSEGRILKTEFEQPKLRYALLISDTSDAKSDAMLEAMNCEENTYGGIIKVFIVSPIGRDGINVNNVTSINIVGSSWNESNIFQAESRAIRATSHDDLLKILQSTEGPNATIPINTYKWTAVAQDGSSIDYQMYRKAEYKDRKIAKIFRFAKQCAWDCQIHRGRNIRPTDQPGSAACDYDVCDYQCVDPIPDYIDYRSYDVLFSNDVVEALMEDIKLFFHQKSSASMEEITQAIDGIKRTRHKFIKLAIERLIVQKIDITDKFGYTCYLQEDGGVIFLIRSYPLEISNYDLSYYNKPIIAYTSRDLADIINIRQSIEQNEISQELEQMNPSDPNFLPTLDSLGVDTQVRLLESAILDILAGRSTPFNQAITAHYNGYIFAFPEPVTEINRKVQEVANIGKGKGRRAKPESKLKVVALADHLKKFGQLIPDTDTETVYSNIVYLKQETQTSYATTANVNKIDTRIRILKPSEGIGWRDANVYERPVYSLFIQQIRGSQNTMGPIFGEILHDGVFRVIDRTKETAQAATSRKSQKRGAVCAKMPLPEIIDVLWGIQGPYPPSIGPSQYSSEQLIYGIHLKDKKYDPNVLATWSRDKLDFYWAWNQVSKPGGHMSRENICEVIKDHMDRTGRIIRM